MVTAYLKWVDHKPNPRFAIYDSCTPEEEGDDLILDQQTGFIWARNANLAGKMLTWEDAIIYCQNLALSNRKGWRLPTKGELSSLVDPSQSAPALPRRHPFINVKDIYWTSTTQEASSDYAWYVRFGGGVMGAFSKISKFYVWPVLGR